MIPIRHSSDNKTFARSAAQALAIAVLATMSALSQAADSFRISDTGLIGLGTDSPVRQLHLQGSNATFRMDRDRNSAAFILVRTAENDFGTVLKTFVVGADATGPGDGEFIINDLSTAVSGAGIRRMTIKNDGNVVFTGGVTAASFTQPSSLRYKEDVATIQDAGSAVDKLRGVRFHWKDSGKPALGFIAEEVAEVFPEVVQRDQATGQVEGMDYSAMTAVLLQAVKEQQTRLASQQKELDAYQAAVATNQARIAQLEANLIKFEALQARVSDVEAMLHATQPRMVSLQKP